MKDDRLGPGPALQARLPRPRVMSSPTSGVPPWPPASSLEVGPGMLGLAGGPATAGGGDGLPRVPVVGAVARGARCPSTGSGGEAGGGVENWGPGPGITNGRPGDAHGAPQSGARLQEVLWPHRASATGGASCRPASHLRAPPAPRASSPFGPEAAWPSPGPSSVPPGFTVAVCCQHRALKNCWHCQKPCVRYDSPNIPLFLLFC